MFWEEDHNDMNEYSIGINFICIDIDNYSWETCKTFFFYIKNKIC